MAPGKESRAPENDHGFTSENDDGQKSQFTSTSSSSEIHPSQSSLQQQTKSLTRAKNPQKGTKNHCSEFTPDCHPGKTDSKPVSESNNPDTTSECPKAKSESHLTSKTAKPNSMQILADDTDSGSTRDEHIYSARTKRVSCHSICTEKSKRAKSLTSQENTRTNSKRKNKSTSVHTDTKEKCPKVQTGETTTKKHDEPIQEPEQSVKEKKRSNKTEKTKQIAAKSTGKVILPFDENLSEDNELSATSQPYSPSPIRSEDSGNSSDGFTAQASGSNNGSPKCSVETAHPDIDNPRPFSIDSVMGASDEEEEKEEGEAPDDVTLALDEKTWATFTESRSQSVVQTEGTLTDGSCLNSKCQDEEESDSDITIICGESQASGDKGRNILTNTSNYIQREDQKGKTLIANIDQKTEMKITVRDAIVTDGETKFLEKKSSKASQAQKNTVKAQTVDSSTVNSNGKIRGESNSAPAAPTFRRTSCGDNGENDRDRKESDGEPVRKRRRSTGTQHCDNVSQDEDDTIWRNTNSKDERRSNYSIGEPTSTTTEDCSVETEVGITHAEGKARRKLKRTHYSQADLQILNLFFEQDNWLSPIKQEALARQLGYSDTQIKTWFQNKRASVHGTRRPKGRDKRQQPLRPEPINLCSLYKFSPQYGGGVAMPYTSAYPPTAARRLDLNHPFPTPRDISDYKPRGISDYSPSSVASAPPSQHAAELPPPVRLPPQDTLSSSGRDQTTQDLVKQAGNAGQIKKNSDHGRPNTITCHSGITQMPANVAQTSSSPESISPTAQSSVSSYPHGNSNTEMKSLSPVIALETSRQQSNSASSTNQHLQSAQPVPPVAQVQQPQAIFDRSDPYYYFSPATNPFIAAFLNLRGDTWNSPQFSPLISPYLPPVFRFPLVYPSFPVPQNR